MYHKEKISDMLNGSTVTLIFFFIINHFFLFLGMYWYRQKKSLCKASLKKKYVRKAAF